VTPPVRRLVFLSAEANSIDEARDAVLPRDLPVIALCWLAPVPATAVALSNCTLVDLSASEPSAGERLLRWSGLMALDAALRTSSPGRLLASIGLAHRSRLFAARVGRSSAWQPQPGDAVIALDLAATRAAWLAQRHTAGVTATLGLRAGLARLG